MKTKTKTKEALRSALFEAFFVVLGVTLALYANSWWQQKTNEKDAEIALSYIMQEMQNNKATVEASIKYHTELLTLIRIRQDENAIPLASSDFPKGYIFPARLVNTAWRSAIDTGVIKSMGFENILPISQAYSQQAQYSEMASSFSKLIYESIFKLGAESIPENYENLAGLVSAMLYRERQLIVLYEKNKLLEGATQKSYEIP